MSKFIIRARHIEKSKGKLELIEVNEKHDKIKYNKIFETEAFFGRNGVTINKKEGDGKTPLGTFKLGIVLGIHKKEEIRENSNYMEINENLYWVDDSASNYYNQLVDITKVKKDWKSAEHLIEYSKEYEYLIEIKTNPKNISGNGSAIFLHCSSNRPTAGCIAIDKEKMEEVLKKIDNNAIIIIERN